MEVSCVVFELIVTAFGIEGTTCDPKFVANVTAMAGSAAKQAAGEA
jgi:hypothetical protein